MKKVILGAAAALAIAAPAHAATGYIEANAEATNHDNAASDFTAFALGGAVTESFSNGWMVQGDAQTNDTSYDGASLDDAQSYAAVHAAFRNDQYSLGGFIGLNSIFDYSVRMLGAEGQWYFSNATLTGNLTYAQADDSVDTDSWGADIGGTYFVNDNFGINGNVGYTDFDSGSSQDAWNIGVGAEYQLASSPVSLFADYNHVDDDTFDTDTFRIGARLNLGTGSLKERTNSGASLDGARQVFNSWRVWY
jgi:hypothetical protein